MQQKWLKTLGVSLAWQYNSSESYKMLCLATEISATGVSLGLRGTTQHALASVRNINSTSDWFLPPSHLVCSNAEWHCCWTKAAHAKQKTVLRDGKKRKNQVVIRSRSSISTPPHIYFSTGKSAQYICCLKEWERSFLCPIFQRCLLLIIMNQPPTCVPFSSFGSLIWSMVFRINQVDVCWAFDQLSASYTARVL